MTQLTSSRRRFLQGCITPSAAALTSFTGPALAARQTGLKLGVTDWSLQLDGKVEAVAAAARLGFEGVEISVSRRRDSETLFLQDPELLAQYVAEAKKHRVRIAGAFLHALDVNALKNDPLGRKWVEIGIPIARALDAGILHLPLYGRRGGLKTREEMDYVGDLLRELAPAAQSAGLVLGLGNTISAEDNVYIIERSRSNAVKVYYDVWNARHAGFDIIKEIAWLGTRHICQFHLKDKGYLGEGAIDFPLLMDTIKKAGFRGFLNLETNSPSKDVEADMTRNLAYVRKLL